MEDEEREGRRDVCLEKALNTPDSKNTLELKGNQSKVHPVPRSRLLEYDFLWRCGITR
jgi:hypothetical protein